MSPQDDGPGTGVSGPRPDVVALRARLRDLQAARDELPPHSGQGWRDDLDAQIAALRRRIARPPDHERSRPPSPE